MPEFKTQDEKISEPSTCPKVGCGSTDFYGGSVIIDEGKAYQVVSCNECDSTWQDNYVLSSYNVLED